MEGQVIYGTAVGRNPVPSVREPLLHFPGFSLWGDDGFSVSEEVFARHLLLLGGSGCGKTNSFLFAVDQLEKRLSEKDICIIFDTKGEYYDSFHKPGDVVIGNSAQFRPFSHSWNIFDEVLADGEDDLSVGLNAREIAAALFHDRGSATQPFFCNAARDIFAAILIHFIRMAQMDPGYEALLNNKDLLAAFRHYDADSYRWIFSRYDDMKNLLSYLGDGRSNQALGVLGELNSMLSEYFIGIFAANHPRRQFSMREAVRARGGVNIFIEYDLSVGETLTPIYRLLVDQALKEALSRNDRDRQPRMYLVADEFKLLPKLQHIDDALNFGRGLGVRVIAGIQSIDQLYDIYGERKGAVIAGGFGSLFAFHTNDSSSREYIQRRFGANVVAYEYHSQQKNQYVNRERDGNTVEEWDQLNLGTGQAVIGLGDEPPFLFQFAKYA